MGQLNIKDAALIAEAKELAALLGTTATGAVREAVAEKLGKGSAAAQIRRYHGHRGGSFQTRAAGRHQ